MTGVGGSRYKQLLTVLRKKDIGAFEREDTLSHSAENSFWKKLWTCRRADYRLNEIIMC